MTSMRRWPPSAVIFFVMPGIMISSFVIVSSISSRNQYSQASSSPSAGSYSKLRCSMSSSSWSCSDGYRERASITPVDDIAFISKWGLERASWRRPSGASGASGASKGALSAETENSKFASVNGTSLAWKFDK